VAAVPAAGGTLLGVSGGASLHGWRHFFITLADRALLGLASVSVLFMTSSRKSKHLRAATLADVGRAAGVSAMAASAVLNNARTSSRISDETRTRILAAAAKLNYRPNIAARALASRRMHTLGLAAVIDPGGLNHYFLGVFDGVLEAAARREQNTTVFALHDWARDTARLHRMCDGRIDGLILLAPTFGREAAPHLPAHTPFVSIHANHLFPGIVNVESDEEEGAFELVRYLIARGHRRILHLAGPEGFIGANRRIRGYRRALAAARLPFERSLLMHAGFTTELGREAMHHWLKQQAGEPLPQAVFCANDGVAIGCLEVLAEVGLRVPDDISVAGFDDTLAARTAVPQLTTVRQPLREIGERAVELLLARIEQSVAQSTAIPKPVVLPVEIVPRASVGAPPAVQRLAPGGVARPKS
jgi:LacI family transcriptional regulator